MLDKHNFASDQLDCYSLKQLQHDQYKQEYDLASKDYESVTGSFAELHVLYNELKKVSAHIQGSEDELLRELKAQDHNLHVWNNRCKFYTIARYSRLSLVRIRIRRHIGSGVQSLIPLAYTNARK